MTDDERNRLLRGNSVAGFSSFTKAMMDERDAQKKYIEDLAEAKRLALGSISTMNVAKMAQPVHDSLRGISSITRMMMAETAEKRKLADEISATQRIGSNSIGMLNAAKIAQPGLDSICGSVNAFRSMMDERAARRKLIDEACGAQRLAIESISMMNSAKLSLPTINSVCGIGSAAKALMDENAARKKIVDNISGRHRLGMASISSMTKVAELGLKLNDSIFGVSRAARALMDENATAKKFIDENSCRLGMASISSIANVDKIGALMDKHTASQQFGGELSFKLGLGASSMLAMNTTSQISKAWANPLFGLESAAEAMAKEDQARKNLVSDLFGKSSMSSLLENESARQRRMYALTQDDSPAIVSPFIQRTNPPKKRRQTPKKNPTESKMTLRQFNECSPVQFCQSLTSIQIENSGLESSITKMESISVSSDFPDQLNIELAVLRYETLNITEMVELCWELDLEKISTDGEKSEKLWKRLSVTKARLEDLKEITHSLIVRVKNWSTDEPDFE